MHILVARDKVTKKAVEVNSLVLDTDDERTLFTKRQVIAGNRKLPKPSTTAKNQDTINQLLNTGSALADMPALGNPKHILMHLTCLENSFVCQPQNVNTAGRVFGGFLSMSYNIYLLPLDEFLWVLIFVWL
jgi:acyl-coenzyme A thioesterase 9